MLGKEKEHRRMPTINEAWSEKERLRLTIENKELLKKVMWNKIKIKDLEGRIETIRETLDFGKKIVEDNIDRLQQIDEVLRVDNLEEILVEANGEVTDTEERYGNYFYKLAAAVNKAYKKAKETKDE